MMLHNLLSRFVFFLVLTRVYSAILRLPCAKYADFCIIEGDKRMEGHVLMEIRNTDDAQCTVECVQQPKCRSYNLEINERICQLNSKALADEGTILVSKPGWVYRSTDYNSTLLGTACEQLNPCAQGILCKDKCDLPYFECIYCDKYHYGLHCDRRRDLDECASNPCKNGAVCVEKIADYSCTCLAGYTGRNCEQDINECGSFPCLNGGTCKDEVNKFSCTCVPGFSGSRCEINIDECASNPCKNGAVCVEKVADYSCTCPAGYTGRNCEEDINECGSLPCLNGGTCKDEVNKFSCTCVPGFSGSKCETNIDECASNPCQNGAVCVEKVADYSCTCPAGYTGKNCEQDIDECASNPCKNGAVCVEKVADYSCTCLAGYTGRNCEQDINECGSLPCLNGGTCKDEVNKFSCTCVPGFSGSKCETNINECQSKPCGIGGNCVDLVNKYQCNCHNGFYGPLCKCPAIFSASKGSIISPFYPQKYPHLFKCLYTINAPQGKFIKIDFDFFEVEASGCVYDFLTITESSSNVQNSIKYCGTGKLPSCVSRSNNLEMTFTTDRAMNKKGFNMSYVFVDAFGSFRSCAGS